MLKRACCILFAVLVAVTCSQSAPNAEPDSNHQDKIRGMLEGMKTRSQFSKHVDDYRARIRALLREEDVPFLNEQLLAHRYFRTRTFIVHQLILFRASSSVQPLITVMERDEHPSPSEAAAYALGLIGLPEAEPALVAAMRSSQRLNTRLRAAEALNRFNSSTASQAIVELSKTETDPNMRRLLQFLVENPGYRCTRRPKYTPGQVAFGYLNGTRYAVYVPRAYVAGLKHRLLVSVHGSDGNATRYMDTVRKDAEAHHAVALAPFFDRANFYVFGSLEASHGGPRPDLRLIEIIEEVQRSLDVDDRILLFGHSQGGGFVSRFALAHPDLVARAAICGAGTPVRNDPDVPFPNGTKLCPETHPDLKALDFTALARLPVAIVVGSRDKQRHPVNLSLYNEIRECAARHSLKDQSQYLVVENGGHNGASNWRPAREFLLGPTP
ncbi:MAG: hypothetical protein GY851_30865 [bacterium]|nr:hypothetical protein [bacterium]